MRQTSPPMELESAAAFMAADPPPLVPAVDEWADPGLNLARSATIGWSSALATAQGLAAANAGGELAAVPLPPPATGAPAVPAPPVDWRGLLASGKLETAGPGSAKRQRPAAGDAVVPSPLPPLGDDPAADAAAAAERARVIQEKNRTNQRRHRERQRCKLAAAEAAASKLEADLAAARAEVNRLGARLLAAEAAARLAATTGTAPIIVPPVGGCAQTSGGSNGGDEGGALPADGGGQAAYRLAYETVAATAAAAATAGGAGAAGGGGAATVATAAAPHPAARALDALFTASARLRAALRGCSYEVARGQVEEMHLSELLRDRQLLSARVAALVRDPSHADPSTPAGAELATLLELRHATVRAFFASTPKPMHMMFAAFERSAASTTGGGGGGGGGPDAGGSSGAASAFAKWFHALRAMDLAPHQADALVAARTRYVEAIRSLREERMAIKKALIGAEPSQDTWGARSTTALTSQVGLEALASILEREERAAADLELVAQRVLTPAQFAVAYVCGAPSLPDWLAIGNLLFHDPSRAAASGATAASGGGGIGGDDARVDVGQPAPPASGGPRTSACGAVAGGADAAATTTKAGAASRRSRGSRGARAADS